VEDNRTRGRRARALGRSLGAAGLALTAMLTACAAPGGGGTREKSISGRPAGDRAPGTGPRPFTLLATGDVIPYPSIMRQAQADPRGTAHGFARILSGVRSHVRAADVALCHLETPFGDEDGPFTGYPLFRSPPQLARALRATGYDSCSTASNHTLDDGTRGISRTLAAMDAAGLRHTGSARTAAESRRPALLRAGGARIAHLSYTYGTNGIPRPPGRPWAVSMLDPRRVVGDARAARRAGADVVVVSVHWGTEWQQAPDRHQVRLARALTRSRHDGRRDVDLVLGTHNHVPQPYEKVNGTWVVYGLGDQIASFVPSLYRGNDGSAALFTFSPPRRPGTRWRVTRARFLVGHSDTGPPFRVVRATPDRFPEVHARVRDAVLGRGAAGDGLAEAP
jgi:hypothetical protein